MKYRVIADEKSVRGFSLLGIEGTVVACGEMLGSQAGSQASSQACEQAGEQALAQARSAFESAVSDPSLGALIISDRVAALIEPMIAEHKLSGRFPEIIGVGEDHA